MAEGYFVLLPDKRDNGASQGDWRTASYSDLTRDAGASAAFLRKQFQLKKIGLMGLSGEEIKEVLKLHVLMYDYAMHGNWQPLGRKFKEMKTASLG